MGVGTWWEGTRHCGGRSSPRGAPAWPGRKAGKTEYVLVEAFRDDEAGAAHVQSAHFKAAQQTLPPHLVETPRVVNMSVPQQDWSLLGEMAVPGTA
ncbi:putative quinol monooxygenase [Streptomyces sp. NPDC014995]|uniref:putative quinol monooxygenase n=1 Tax=Streptomyces sp. NPDC014995 TaxID=3364936 RepID=UPI0036FA287C